MRRRLAPLLYDGKEPEREVEGEPVMGSGHGEATEEQLKKRGRRTGIGCGTSTACSARCAP